MKHIWIATLLFCVLLMSACAMPAKMGLVKSTDKLDLNGKALLLMSAELVNEFKPEYQPSATHLIIESIDGKQLLFEADDEGTLKSAKGYKYVFRVMIEKGKYIIRIVKGEGSVIHTSGITPTTGIFLMPLHSEIEIKDSSVIYLGKVFGKIRERKNDEFRAGPISPAELGLYAGIYQAKTGFSTGTFDVTIVDNFEEDMRFMKETFPALKNIEVRSQILPAFDREKAQKWWQAH